MKIKISDWLSIKPDLFEQILNDISEGPYHDIDNWNVIFDIKSEKKAKMLILKYPDIIKKV